MWRLGDKVQTPLGKGTIRDVRNHGQLLVEIHGRSVVVTVSTVTRLDEAGDGQGRHPAVSPAPPSGASHAPGETRQLDLHGLTVEEALARVDVVLDRCLREDVVELRVIHGRSGGRIRAAVHRHLTVIASVRQFRVDPRNPGVTIVSL